MTELKIFEYAVNKSMELGHGMFAYVYKGKHFLTKQEVAMKRICNVTIAEEEIKVLKAAGQHLNIVHLYHFFKGDKIIWMALELCDLGDLQTYCKDHVPDIDMTVYVVHQIATALEYLHTRPKPIIHRDVKPGNILLKTERGDKIIAKLADFGLSKLGEDKDSTKEWLLRSNVGTELYKAPEFWDASNNAIRYTLAVDIFALGLVLECLVHFGQGLTTSLLPASAVRGMESENIPIGQVIYTKKNNNNLVKYVRGESNEHRVCKDIIVKATQCDPRNRCKLSDVIKRLGHIVPTQLSLHAEPSSSPPAFSRIEGKIVHTQPVPKVAPSETSTSSDSSNDTLVDSDFYYMDTRTSDVLPGIGVLDIYDYKVPNTPDGVLPHEGVQLDGHHVKVWLTNTPGTVAVGSSQSAGVTFVSSNGVILFKAELSALGVIKGGLWLWGDTYGVITGNGSDVDAFEFHIVTVNVHRNIMKQRKHIFGSIQPVSLFSDVDNIFCLLGAGADERFAFILHCDRFTLEEFDIFRVAHKDITYKDSGLMMGDKSFYITSWKHNCVNHFAPNGDSIESIGTRAVKQSLNIPGLLYSPRSILATVDTGLRVQCLENIHIYKNGHWDIMPSFVKYAWHIVCDGEHFYTVYRDKLRIHKIVQKPADQHTPDTEAFQDIKSVSAIPRINPRFQRGRKHYLPDSCNKIWPTQDYDLFMVAFEHSCSVALITLAGDMLCELKLKMKKARPINSGLLIKNNRHLVISKTMENGSMFKIIALDVNTNDMIIKQRSIQGNLASVIKPMKLFDYDFTSFGLLRWSEDEQISQVQIFKRSCLTMMRKFNLVYPSMNTADNICVTPIGAFLISSYRRGKVYMFTGDGVNIGSIGTEADKPNMRKPGQLYQPLVIRFDYKGGVIVVTHDDVIHRFQNGKWCILTDIDPVEDICFRQRRMYIVYKNSVRKYKSSI